MVPSEVQVQTSTFPVRFPVPNRISTFAIHNPLAKKTDNSAVVSREPDETDLRKYKAEEYRLNYARWTYLGQKR